MYLFGNGVGSAITISKHEKTDESTRPLGPTSFIVFECLEIVMKHDARVFEMTSLKEQYKIMQCCICPIFFFKMPCMCDLLYSVDIYCIYELLFLTIQYFRVAPNLYSKSNVNLK